jgi:Protein of unknown function (DUF2946)
MRAVNRRTVSAWLAILALSLQALWPLLAQAEPAWSRVVAPVCRGDGRAPIGQKQSEACRLHCAFCLSGADRHAAPPPAPIALLRIAPLRVAVTAPAVSTAGRLAPASPAQPRAPPALS